MRRYAARVDANHAEIVAALEGIGCYVVDCSHVGHGFPDLLVWWRGRITPLEVKDGGKPPSARKLTARQVVFHAEAAAKDAPVRVVTDVESAIAAMQAATLGRV
ncbi:MAG TPA: hypothetical protein VFT88_05175 [Acidobacteriaceae bacterium]|nr:hypothetical protein [Acidobacteriaceae bacterium]